MRVSEKLRVTLAQFVGPDGFAALLRRALALARADLPSLEMAKVTPDGQLEGFETRAADAKNDVEAATAITVHLLELLVTFIGESLTLRLMSDAWADVPGQTNPGQTIRGQTIDEPEDL